MLAFAAALWESLGFGLRAGLFPWAVRAPDLVLGLVQLVRDLTGRRGIQAETADDPADAGVPAEVVKRRTVEICLWIVGFWTAIWLLGFSLATLCMTFLYLRLSARERWLMCAVLTVAAAAFVYGLFDRALGVPFPAARLFAWLGVG